MTTIIQAVNKHVAIADAFGADWVTTSPFKQRLLLRRGAGLPGPQALIRADVPQLSAASALALARVAAVDEAVDALREVTRQCCTPCARSAPASSARQRRNSAGSCRRGHAN